MKTIFQIHSGNEIREQQVLLFELGADHCSYGLYDPATASVDALAYISFEEQEAEEVIPGILNRLDKKNIARAVVCSSMPQALLTPFKFSQSAASLVEVSFDEPAQDYFTESVPEWQTFTAFGLPDPITNAFRERFSKLQFTHAYTLSVKTCNQYEGAQLLTLHFTPRHFRVFVKKDGQLQLAQVYSYKTGLDVVYYLLKIVEELGLDQSILQLEVSGLVDAQSGLYAEIVKYFVHVRFATLPQASLPENDYPQHYFSSLFNLASCVS